MSHRISANKTTPRHNSPRTPQGERPTKKTTVTPSRPLTLAVPRGRVVSGVCLNDSDNLDHPLDDLIDNNETIIDNTANRNNANHKANLASLLLENTKNAEIEGKGGTIRAIPSRNHADDENGEGHKDTPTTHHNVLVNETVNGL